jgi:hypothetical protein
LEVQGARSEHPGEAKEEPRKDFDRRVFYPTCDQNLSAALLLRGATA